MMSIPKNNLIMDLIKECVNNILNFHNIFNINDNNFNNIDNILSFTGPVLLYNVLSKNPLFNINKVIKFQHCHNNKYFHNYMKLYVEYNGENIITKQYYNYKSNGIHYSDLWRDKKIIYDNNL